MIQLICFRRNELAISNTTNNTNDIIQLIEEQDCKRKPLHVVAATYYVLRNYPIPKEVKDLVRPGLNLMLCSKLASCFALGLTGRFNFYEDLLNVSEND